MTRKRKNVEPKAEKGVEQEADFYEDTSKNHAANARQKNKFKDQEQQFQEKRPRFEQDVKQEGQSGDTNPDKFPTELIHYLRQMARETPDPELVDVFMEKCLEEVKDKEELLLNYTEGCFVVEQLFLRSKNGAYEFLERLNHRKKANRLQLIYNAASERTLEKLMYVLAPLTEEKHVELLSNWIDLTIDNWQDVLFDRSGSFFIRTLGRVLVGLSEEQLKYKSTFEAIQQAGVSRKKMLPSAKQELLKLLTRVFDFVSMKDFLNLGTVALVVQNFAAFDKFIKSKIGSEFAQKFIEKENVGNAWRLPNSSRVWESLVELMDTEELQLELFNAVKDQLVDVATHDFGRYPLETLFKRTDSVEIAQEVANQLLPKFEEFLQGSTIPPIVGQTLQLIAKHEDLQSSAIKIIRRLFNAKENGPHFFPNLLTLNNSNAQAVDNDELVFDVDNSELFGSIIIEKLFQFHKNKTLISSFMLLSAETLNRMATHTVASHAFDGFAKSSTIKLGEKKELFNKLDLNTIIKNSYGSRVFESLWFELEWTPAERDQLVNDLFLPLLASTERNKFVGILIGKLHIHEFRENKKQWRSQLNKWLEEERQNRRNRQQFDNRPRSNQGGEKPSGSGKGKKHQKKTFRGQAKKNEDE